MRQDGVVDARLSVVGLGKLGAPMAAVFAARGFDAIGIDLNPSPVRAINQGRAPVEEPQLQEFIDASCGRLSATGSFEDAIGGSDITFVIVPTPSGPDAFFSNALVVDAVERIGRALVHKRGDHLVVITSTVMPGSTGGVIREALERTSGRRVGVDVGLCYSPEFIALGSVIRDLLQPDMVLIGECDVAYGSRLERVYTAVTGPGPAVHRMSFVNAEICKIAVNTYVTTKISYANMLAELCDRLDGADVDVIARALGADTRIGPKYLKGGVAYGGPCFPRDNKAFAALGRSLGVRCDIAEATDAINDHQVHRLMGAVAACADRGARVAVLGLSYKPQTNVVEESQGLILARMLVDEGYRVIVADPLSASAARAILGDEVEALDRFEAAVDAADVVVITTPWPEIVRLPVEAFVREPDPLPVIDPWGLLGGTGIARAARLISPGRGGSRSGAAGAFAGLASRPR